MTSKPGSQTIAIHILPNISQNKSTPKMKFDQLIEYNKRNIFLLQLSFNIFRYPSTYHTVKANFHTNFRPLIQRYGQF